MEPLNLLPPTGRIEIVPPAGDAYRFEASPELTSYLEDELELGVNLPADEMQEVVVTIIWIGPQCSYKPRFPKT
jgi:hypothetical protein